MLDNSKQVFRATELEQDLLSTPFGVQTNWHMITGMTCSGKSTLIDQLADKGFQTVPEAGRQYFEIEIAKGRTIDEVRENVAALVRGVIDMQLRSEGGLRAIDVTFLDRGIPDALAFCRVFGLDPNDILSECFHYQYSSVFILNRLPYQQDRIRAGDEATRDFLDNWLSRDYAALGYEVVRVPVLSEKDRLEFVLEKLSDQGLN